LYNNCEIKMRFIAFFHFSIKKKKKKRPMIIHTSLLI
jgi:hypothetical protein